jgi:hypothetical protein
MRNVNLDKFTTDLDTVITAENVQYLGENMALCTLKHKRIYRGINFEKLYYDLVRDIHCKNNIDRHISDGYDFAQTAICFLCEYIGLPLGTVITDRLNHRVTIRHACYSLLCNMMYRKYMTTRNEFGIKRTDKSKVTEPFNEYDKEASYLQVYFLVCPDLACNKVSFHSVIVLVNIGLKFFIVIKLMSNTVTYVVLAFILF